MRKLLTFIISVAMVGGGLFLFGAELLTATRIKGVFVIGAVMLVFVGGYLLWVDFIAPALGIKTGEE
jgi:hypothetical protein